MSALAEYLRESPVVIEAPPIDAAQPVVGAPSALAITEDEQIRALVEHLFFRPDTPLHHIAFAAVDSETETAPLCFAVARVLSEEGSRDIGLIDGSPRSEPLHVPLGLRPGSSFDATWQVATRLWLVPRQSWLDPADSPQIPDRSLSRLRDLTAEFDCSILRCAPPSWLVARLAQACDGVVLVLTANKTRRVIATQIGDLFKRARIPLLGTVLTGRRFPVPERLYRSL